MEFIKLIFRLKKIYFLTQFSFFTVIYFYFFYFSSSFFLFLSYLNFPHSFSYFYSFFPHYFSLAFFFTHSRILVRFSSSFLSSRILFASPTHLSVLFSHQFFLLMWYFFNKYVSFSPFTSQEIMPIQSWGWIVPKAT